ncbi:MAG: hypothetical protein FJ397_11860 [Verrucomicrobia bacterium]|nr:hypothetical protein [Verrucomicrobiota bacterium]
MIRPVLLPLLLLLAPARLTAWDYEGHRIVAQLALAVLPEGFPRIVARPEEAERVAFLSAEPDRWRNVPDLPLKHAGGSWGDHFLDLEYLTDAGLDLETLTSFRYEFVLQFARGRAAHAAAFKPIDPARNLDRTAEWPGFAPWAIAEHFARLRSGFSYLRVFEEVGTPAEVANARANLLYVMGLLAHYVGDCSQPLHTTKHYNGWSGDNPRGYPTWNGLHAWIDGGIIARTGLRFPALRERALPPRVLPLGPRVDGRDPLFVAVLDYIRVQHRQVETIYELGKAGRLGQAPGAEVPPETRRLIEEQLLAGGQMLASVWLTAFRGAVPDTYLRAAIARRQAAAP